MNRVPMEQLAYATFAGLQHAKFRVRLDASNRVELELVEVRVVGPASKSGSGSSEAGPASFSLLFHGPETPFLAQRMYVMEQETIGEFDLFIVPVGRTGGGFQYQAIFNRQARPG
jgi:Domain of unknown function (DUF6916)